jgi:hypothetical protein
VPPGDSQGDLAPREKMPGGATKRTRRLRAGAPADVGKTVQDTNFPRLTRIRRRRPSAGTYGARQPSL